MRLRLLCQFVVAEFADDMTPDYKFDLMYSKRAFVHWYVGEGMEEVSFLFRVDIVHSLMSMSG